MSVSIQPGKVYSLFGKNGIEEIQQTGLKRGQVVSYEDMANPKRCAVVTEDVGSGYGQRCVFLDGSHESHVSTTAINGAGGWRLENEILPEIEIQQAEQRLMTVRAQRQEEQRQKEEERQNRVEIGKARFEAMRPGWAKAVIVAQMKINDCDSQTDYFNTKTGRRVFLAWSKTTRDSFSEMRKAAATFSETKDFGPGCSKYTPVVVLAVSVKSNGSYYHAGQCSHWHSELDGNHWNRQTFTTFEAAQEYIKSKGEPHAITFDGVSAAFRWEIREESIEHREKYRGGSGYYLGTGGYDTGWIVKKIDIHPNVTEDLYLIFSDDANVAPGVSDVKEQEATPEARHKIKIRFNSRGIEIEFSGKPSAEIRAKMKACGYRWHKKNGYWYSKRTPESEQCARTIQN